MKTPHLIGCAVVGAVTAALVLGAAPPDKPPLQVENGSMEKIAPGETIPAGYYRMFDLLAAVDRTVTFEGKPTVKVLLRGLREGGGIVQAVPSTVPEGKICRFRIHVRTQDLDGNASLFIYRYPMPDEGFASTKKLSGTNDWTTLEALVPTKKGGDSFQVRMMVDGTVGRVWFAGFEASVPSQ